MSRAAPAGVLRPPSTSSPDVTPPPSIPHLASISQSTLTHPRRIHQDSVFGARLSAVTMSDAGKSRPNELTPHELQCFQEIICGPNRHLPALLALCNHAATCNGGACASSNCKKMKVCRPHGELVRRSSPRVPWIVFVGVLAYRHAACRPTHVQLHHGPCEQSCEQPCRSFGGASRAHAAAPRAPVW